MKNLVDLIIDKVGKPRPEVLKARKEKRNEERTVRENRKQLMANLTEWKAELC